jgi:hypothetical protein
MGLGCADQNIYGLFYIPALWESGVRYQRVKYRMMGRQMQSKNIKDQKINNDLYRVLKV